MNRFLPLVAGLGTAWDGAAAYQHEDRELRHVGRILVRGAVDFVFRRFDRPCFVVAADTTETLKAISTYYILGGPGERNTLVIEEQSVESQGTSASSVGRAIVGLALPKAPGLIVQGSGDAFLLDVQQAKLALKVEGSGDITAGGQVDHLDVQSAGQGKVNTFDLIVRSARLELLAAGDIMAFVRDDLTAILAGSGDIKVRGNPPRRLTTRSGSGHIEVQAQADP